jgi:hypothetical protein
MREVRSVVIGKGRVSIWCDDQYWYAVRLEVGADAAHRFVGGKRMAKGMDTGRFRNAGSGQIFLDQLGDALSGKGFGVLIEKQLLIPGVPPDCKVAFDSSCGFLLKLNDAALLPLLGRTRTSRFARSTSVTVSVASSETRSPSCRNAWSMAKSRTLPPARARMCVYSMRLRKVVSFFSFLGVGMVAAGDEVSASMLTRWRKYSRMAASLRARDRPARRRSAGWARYSVISARVVRAGETAVSVLSASQVRNWRMSVWYAAIVAALLLAAVSDCVKLCRPSSKVIGCGVFIGTYYQGILSGANRKLLKKWFP